jgi:hypothetical protein
MAGMTLTKTGIARTVIEVSFNAKLIDKTPPTDKRWLTQGFDFYEVTPDQLCEAINQGCSYSYKFEGGIRKSENFLGADLISVDIDGGRTITETLADPIVQSYGSIWYTTPSHTPDRHRFRLIFILPYTVTDANDLKAAARSLSRRLGGDMSATDAARLFYGSTGSEPTDLGGQLSEAYLEELIKDGRVAPIQDSISGNRPTTNRSQMPLDLEQAVKLGDGSLVTLKSVTAKASLYCPYHPDKSPSAFVDFTAKKVMYLHCSSCELTWWSVLSSTSTNTVSFETAAANLEKKSVHKPTVKTALELFSDDDPATGHLVEHVTIHNSKYLKITKDYPGVTFIKSPKGSGKTEYLKTLIGGFVNRYPSFAEYEEDSFDGEKQIFHSDRSVLLIGHRQALIGELCQRLGLNCYLHDSDHERSEIEQRKKRYGVCLDSLWKVRNKTYDLIVIDEAEQVLSHFLSDTIGSARFSIFEIFAQLFQKASRIVLLDADLGWITFKTVTQVMNADGLTANPVPVHIHINQWKPTLRPYRLYALDGHMLTDLKARILEGKRIFVSSNSKRKIHQIDEVIQKFAKESGLTIPRITITSENSSTKEVQNFIQNVKVETLNYQVILSSPSLGTGVDITFEGDAQHIDCVFGFYENRVNSHFEIDQQLARVRHPKEVNVWISPSRYSFETELAPILKDMESQYLDVISQAGFDMNAMAADYGVSALVMLAARVTSEQRLSKNNLKRNFISYKAQQGWVATFPEADKEAEKEGKKWIKDAKGVISDRLAERLLAAQTLNQYDYIRIRDRMEKLNLPVCEEVMDCYRRTNIELFYCRQIDLDLIRLDSGGNYRAKVNRFRHMTDEVSLREGKLKIDVNQNGKEQGVYLRSIKDFKVSTLLLNTILRQTGVFDGSAFNPDKEYNSADLAKFSAALSRLSTIIQAQLEITIRKDVSDKPVQQMKMFLDLIGLKQRHQRTQVIGGKKTYFYTVDAVSLAGMTGLVEWQKQNEQLIGAEDDEHNQRYSQHWSYVNKLYGFEYDTLQREWLYPGLREDGELITRMFETGHQSWATQFTLHGKTGWLADETGTGEEAEGEFSAHDYDYLSLVSNSARMFGIERKPAKSRRFENWK